MVKVTISQDDLPEVLDYTGEFGPELILFTSFCNWLSKSGHLRSRKIRTYRGMRCFYDDLDCSGIIEKDEPRHYVPAVERPSWLPVKNEHNFDKAGRSPQHMYPDLREKFLKTPLSIEVYNPQLPLLIIHNKYNNEWDRGPVNHIPITVLDHIFEELREFYQIVYVRHGMQKNSEDFSEDQNTTQPFSDLFLLRNHPQIANFDDLYREQKLKGGIYDVNTFKNVLYSRCHYFISSQGGGAHHIALFSGSILSVFHCQGNEIDWAYKSGYYSFMAKIPPVLAVCRLDTDLLKAISLYRDAKIVDGRAFLSSSNAKLLALL